VQLGRDEVEVLLEAGPANRPGGRRQLVRAVRIGDELDDGRPFGQELSVVQAQRGNVTFRVHLPEVFTALGRLGRAIDPLQLERTADFTQMMCGESEHAPGE
jgi:hypothetical protein